MKKMAHQILSTNLRMRDVTDLYIPLPSYPEIKVIVSKLEKLFISCNELEQQIGKSQQDSELLMQAVLQEAFEGNNTKKVSVARKK